MTPNLERLEDFLIHLFSGLTDVNVIRFSNERIVICGLVGVQVAPVDGKWIISTTDDDLKPQIVDEEFEAATEVFNAYCFLLREVLIDEYLADADEPPEPKTEKAT